MVGQFKLGRLQFAEKRFSLVWSSDMLIKVDFVKMERAGWQTPPQQSHKPICWQRCIWAWLCVFFNVCELLYLYPCENQFEPPERGHIIWSEVIFDQFCKASLKRQNDLLSSEDICCTTKTRTEKMFSKKYNVWDLMFDRNSLIVATHLVICTALCFWSAYDMKRLSLQQV